MSALGIVLLIVGAVPLIIGTSTMLGASEVSTFHTGRVVKPFEPGRAIVGLVVFAIGAIIIVIAASVLGWL